MMKPKLALFLVCLVALTGCATSSLGSGSLVINASAAWDKQPEVLEALTNQVGKEWSRNITMNRVNAPKGTTVRLMVQIFSDGGEPYPKSIRGGTQKSRRACARATMTAIRKTIKSWSPEMIKDLGNQQILTFTFVYS